MSYAHLFIGLLITAWVISIEYRLYLNLKLWGDQMKVGQKTRDHLRAVEK